jgi:hypothetical protein
MSSDEEEIVDAPEEGEEEKEVLTDLSNRYVFLGKQLALTIGRVVECGLGKP